MLPIAAIALLTVTGCTRITHTPQCPAQAGIGETVSITAAVSNPGQVARYAWEVIPAGGGTVADPRRVDTTFTPASNGSVTLRLHASDGLFTYINDCVIQVGETNVAVSLLVNPEEAVIGNSILMTCTSVGDEPVISFDITQTAGETVELTPILPGVVAFDAETVGTFTFECVGESVGGIRSAPVAGTVTVSEGGRQPPRGGGR